MSRHRLLLILIFLAAAALRLYGLNNLSPPGLAHDEVAHWQIVRSIQAGRYAVYFTEAYGHEAGFHYIQALFVTLLGDHALALRLPAAFIGLLLVAVTYALVWRLFGRPVALWSAAGVGILFWPVFFSRQGLRAISLPLIFTLSAYLWWRGAGDMVRRDGLWRLFRGPWALVPAGLLAGLSLQTYMAARAVPIFYALFTLYLVIAHRDWWRRHWPAVVLFWLALGIVATPLTTYLLTHPGAEVRVAEVNQPLRALREGDVRPVLSNALRILGAFGWRGDPLWRQNVAPQPVFEPLLVVLFYGGLLLLLWRWRDRRYAFVALWLATAVIPSLVTIDAPSSIRMINALPLLTLIPALLIHNSNSLSTERSQLSTTFSKKSWISVLTIALFLFHLGRTAWWIFQVWPNNDEVRFVWQEALTDAAAYLDASSENTPVAIGGWTPDTMDAPTMAVTLRRDDLALRHFDPQDSLIIPAGTTTRILHPTDLPLSPLLLERLTTWGSRPEVIDTFTLYHLDQPPAVQPNNPVNAYFGGELLFLGYELDESCFQPDLPTCEVLTYLRVQDVAGEPRRIFLHALDDQGEQVVQDDRLHAPAEFWQPGDLIVQQHTLAVPNLSRYQLRIGVYNPETLQRLPLPDGTDAVLLTPALERQPIPTP